MRIGRGDDQSPPDRDADVPMPTITVRLTADEASVARAARQTGMTMTQFVAWAVDREVEGTMSDLRRRMVNLVGFGVLGKNTYGEIADAILEEIAKTHVVLPRKRAERLVELARWAKAADLGEREALLTLDPLEQTRKAIEAYGLRIAMGRAGDDLEPDDLAPLP